jgi:hypothetical protein
VWRLVYHEQNSGQNYNTNITPKSFAKVAKFHIAEHHKEKFQAD